jgi:NADH pyrophosphatase NudC (nudix superfamily)
MAHDLTSRPETEAVRNYLKGVAKQLVDRVYGPKGPVWGTKLTDIEDVFLDLRGVLSDEMLQQALTRQAEQHAEQAVEYHACPECGKPTKARPPADGEEPRVVKTRSGVAQWHEPHQYCTPCRRAFFPSEQESGH